MPGERLAKLTLLASLALDDNTRGAQTTHLRLRLGGAWLDYYRGAYTSQHQFVVPDPDDVQRDYVKQAVDNLLALVRLDVQSRGLPYVVSDSRDLGNDLSTNQPRVAFDIEASQYDNQLDLAFDNQSPVLTGFQVLTNLSNLNPIEVQQVVLPAGVYGSATGRIELSVFGGNRTPYTFKWADSLAFPTGERLNLKAGSYRCTVGDQDGVTTLVTCVVGSDAQLVVVVQQTDDSITLLVRGGVAPYAVAWDDGSSELVRVGLSPGSYAATVSDAHGASQRVVVELTLGRYYWSRNRVEVALDGGDDYRDDPSVKPHLSFVAEVWVEPDYLSGTFVQAGPQTEQPAGPDGRTVFDVQAQLDAYLADELPPATGPLLALASSTFRRFFVKTAEKYGTPPTVAALASAQVQYVLRGGLSLEEEASGNWFAYQRAVRPFLTWEPNVQRVLPTQPAYLYYQHLAASMAVQLMVRVRHVDGSAPAAVAFGEALDVRRFEVCCLRVGPDALGLTDASIAGYDVWVADAAGTVLSAVRSFTLERAYYPNPRFLLYSNSLGGVNCLALLGTAKLGLEVSTQQAQRPRYDAELGDTVTYDRSGQPTLSLQSGPRRRGQVVADQELLLSTRTALVAADGVTTWPGTVVAATFVIRDEGQGLARLGFDYQLPRQRQFTPRLPVVAAGQVVTPIAGGEGPQP